MFTHCLEHGKSTGDSGREFRLALLVWRGYLLGLEVKASGLVHPDQSRGDDVVSADDGEEW